MSEEWNKVEPGNVWKEEKEGDSIWGTLKNIREGNYDNKVYDIETEEGLRTVFGSVVLDDRMAAVKMNQDVKIVFTGTSPSKVPGRNPTKLYDVFTKDEKVKS